MPELTEKLAGHAPANRVGGMRVSQPNRASESSPSKSPTKSEDTSTDERIEKLNQSNMATLISGTPVKLEDAYPVEAVKRFHEKPIPTVDKATHFRPNNVASGQNSLFQPRKF